VTLAVTGTSPSARPGGAGYRLDTFVTVRPAADPGAAAAVLGELADRAAAQPAPVLGPVAYSSRLQWDYIGDVPLSLNYRGRTYWRQEVWFDTRTGAFAGRSTKFSAASPAGKFLGASGFRASGWSRRLAALVNPATLPSAPAALSRVLAALTPKATRSPLYAGGGHLLPARAARQFTVLTQQVNTYSHALRLMANEPLRPAVRAGLLRLLASLAAHPVPGLTWVYLGTATDRTRPSGVAVGAEQASYPGPGLVGLTAIIFDPRTGALLDTAGDGCRIAMGTVPTSQGDCRPYDYAQFTPPTAAHALPRFPDTGTDWADVMW
jgi:hypothetical protein